MKKNLNWVRTLVAICVLAMLVGMLPASAFAEETIEIPEEDYLYVNGESKVLTAGEEMALLCLVVEEPGNVHVLASGVDITMVLFDETAGEVRGVYTSEYGLMDASFAATPGMFILGITGNGEVEILAADDAKTASIYAAAEPSEEASAQPAEVPSEVPAEVPAEAPASDPAADSAEAPAEEAAEAPAEEAAEAPAEEAVEAPAEEAVEAPAEEAVEAPAEEPAEAPAEELVEAPAEEPVDEQALFEAAYANQIALYRQYGEWADLSSVPYDVQLRIKELVDAEKAESAEAVVEEPVEAPAEEPVEAPAEEPAEVPTEEPAEVPTEEPAAASAEEPVEEPVEAPAEEPVEAPAEEPAEVPTEEPAEVSAEEPVEVSAEEPVEEPVEAPAEEAVDEQALFEAAYATQIALYREFGEWADLSSVPYDVQLRIKELVDGEKAKPAEEAAEAPAEEAVEEPVEEIAPVTEVTIAVERRENNEIRLFAEDLTAENLEAVLCQWQYSLDGMEWQNIDGANGADYTFILDETNGSYYWRLIVSEK